MNLYLLIPPLAVLIFSIVTLFIMAKGRRVIIRVCSCLFAFSAVVGFSLYAYSYLSTGSGFADTLYASLRGLYSVARMFSLSDEWSHAASSQNALWIAENVWWQILLWACHVSAVVVIQSVLLAIFGRKLVERFRLRFGLHKKIYIIKGCDKYALMLGENIATHDDPKERFDPKRLIMFIIEEKDNEKDIREKVAHFNAVVKVLDRNSDFEYYLEKARIDRNNWPGIQKESYIILMPQDASAVRETLCAMKLVAKAREADKKLLNIYVFTSSEWVTEKLKDISKKYPYTIHILNESDILARKMIERYSPFKCLSEKGAIDFAKAKAAKDFTVMIMGFGKTGQKALLYLIRNGQFLDSKMRAIIADREMDSIYGRFQKSYPSINLSCQIETQNILSVDVQSKKFFDYLSETVESIDYIVIALGNDTDNTNIAMELQRHYKRRGSTVPVIAVSSQEEVQEEKQEEETTFQFGRRDDVYSEATVINEMSDELAKALNSGYDRGHGAEWHQKTWFNQESKRAQVDFLPYMLELANLDSNQKEAMANIGKIKEEKDRVRATLNKLGMSRELEINLAKTEHLRWNAFHVAMGFSPISIDEMKSRYDRTKDKNYCRMNDTEKLHLCLTDWDELDKVHDAYVEINPGYRNFKDMDGVFNNMAKYLYITRRDGLTDEAVAL